MKMKGNGKDRMGTCPVLVVEVDLAAQGELLVAELGGDGLALLESLSDAAWQWVSSSLRSSVGMGLPSSKVSRT